MTYDDILNAMQKKYEEETGAKPEDCADIGIRLKVLAGEIYRLMTEIAWLRRQAFPQTAIGEELDKHAAQRGLVRIPAKKASGVLTFSRTTPLTYDVTLPKGTICASAGEEPQEYTTLENVVLRAGATLVSVGAEAMQGGAEGNAAALTIDTMVTTPVGFEKVSNQTAFSGGEEEESDILLRARLIEAYATLSNGTNAEFYRRSALKDAQVYSASAVPRENGAGTVTVYIWGNGEAPSAETISRVSERLNKEREVNVAVTVKSATKRPLNVYGYILPKAGVTLADAVARVKEDVRNYYATKKIGDSIYRAEIGAIIMNTGAVQNYSLAANVYDYIGTQGMIPILGVVSMTQLV